MTNKENSLLNNYLNLIAKSSLIVFIGVIISKIFTYLYRILIARVFGPETYGVFSLSLIVIGFFTAVFSLGLGEGGLRYISLYRGKKETNKINYVFKTSFILSIFSGVLGGLILFFSSEFISQTFFHDKSLVIFLKILSLSIPLTIIAGLFLSAVRAFEMIGWYSFFVNILQNVTRVLALVFFIVLGFNIYSITHSYVFGALCLFFGLIIFCTNKIKGLFNRNNLRRKDRSSVRKELLSYSWPLMFSSILLFIFSYIDSFVIGYFRSTLEVGFYNVAFAIIALFGIVPDLFSQLFFPLITKEFSKKNIILIRDLSKQIGKWIFILNLPLFILIFLFPGAIINFLFGAEYLIAENALRIMSLGGIISSWVVVSNNLILMIGKSRLTLINLISFSAINFLFNLILVPKYGILGAAISTTITWVTYSLTLLFQVKRYLSILPFRRKMFGILLIAVLSTTLLIFIKQFISPNFFYLILLSLLFFIFYFILILLTGCLDKNEILLVKKMFSKLKIRK